MLDLDLEQAYCVASDESMIRDRIEMTEDTGYVKCEICGCEFSGFLNWTHLKSHGLTYWEYNEKFPNSPMRSSKWETERGAAVKKGRWENKSAEELLDIKERSAVPRRGPDYINDLSSPVAIELLSRCFTGSGSGKKKYWDSIDSEEKDLHLKSSFHSEEAKFKSQETMREIIRLPSVRRQISESVTAHWSSLTQDEKDSLCEKDSEGVRRFWDNVDPEWKKEFLDRSINSPESRSKAAETTRASWASCTEGQRGARLRRILEGIKGSPSMPEFLLGLWLEGNYPGKWGYNGNCCKGITIGRKVPDFIRLDGSRAVIERWHLE